MSDQRGLFNAMRAALIAVMPMFGLQAEAEAEAESGNL